MSTILPILILAMQQAQGEDAFMRAAVGPLTGQNGYEEYSAAAEIAESPEFQQFENYQPGKDKSSPLEVWQEQVRRFSAITDYIAQGSSKVVYDPKPRSSGTPAPELPGLMGVADFYIRSAYVSLSNGDPQNAERTFEAALQFLYNVDSGTEASGKATSDAAGRLFRALSEDMPKFGVRELDKLGDAMGTLLTQDPSPLTNLRAIQHADTLAAERSLSQPPAGGALTAALQNLSAAQREAALRQFVAVESTYLDSATQLAAQPEAKWEKVDVDDTDPLAAKMAKSSIASNSSVLQTAAKLRTRLRIVRAMARIYEYQWQYMELPTSISDAVKANELADPLSGTSLDYLPQGKSFEVQSQGSAWSGPVKLLDRT